MSLDTDHLFAFAVGEMVHHAGCRQAGAIQHRRYMERSILGPVVDYLVRFADGDSHWCEEPDLTPCNDSATSR